MFIQLGKVTTIYRVFRAPMGSPVSVAVADLYMKDLEEKSMDSAPLEMKLKMWKRYIDDSFEIVKKPKETCSLTT